MTEIKPIQSDYVMVKEYLGVINHGDGYAIVNVYTGECIARNITSFTDALNAIIVLLEHGSKTGETIEHGPDKDYISELHLKPEIERLVRKYAPETRRAKKDSNILGYSWYKCYDQNGNRLGTIRGSSGDRYWQYGGLDSTKHH